MKQKLTREQKARIFARYWGCGCKSSKYSQIGGDMSGIDNCMAGLHVLIDNNEGVPIDEAKLLLKPLSAITDEDLHSLCRIFGLESDSIKRYAGGLISAWKCTKYGSPHNPDGAMVTIYSEGIEWNNGLEIDGVEVHLNRCDAIDYLRQNGYAVKEFVALDHPCNGMTPIQMGIAIDSTKS